MSRSFFCFIFLMLGLLYAQAGGDQIVGSLLADPEGIQADGPFSRAILELLVNGSCEEPLQDGNIPFWTEVVGSNWTQRSANPSPQEGLYYFFPGVAVNAELAQDVDVTDLWYYIDGGSQEFEFSGYVRSYPQSPVDRTLIVLEYLNADKTVVLSSYDSGIHTNTSEWLLLSDTRIAPAGTRFIRIRLISTRTNGSNNDGYYDNLSLKTDIILPLAPQNVSIELASNDVILSWDEVTQDELGDPVDINQYNVYAGEVPEFTCGPDNLAGTVAIPEITLYGQAGSYARRFFKITAVRTFSRIAP